MSSSGLKSTRDALHALLRANEKIIDTVNASPASSNKTVLFQSVLALTNERVLEVSTSTLTKIGLGRPKASSVTIPIRDILGCDFRHGKLFWKNGGKNLVVVQTASGERAWATPNAGVGQAFTKRVCDAL